MGNIKVIAVCCKVKDLKQYLKGFALGVEIERKRGAANEYIKLNSK